MTIKLSKHAQEKHCSERWNATTILAAWQNGRINNIEEIQGTTSDVVCGIVEGVEVGIILSKQNNGDIVVITGYAAPLSYWRSV